jgi:hypothetical protein
VEDRISGLKDKRDTKKTQKYSQTEDSRTAKGV